MPDKTLPRRLLGVPLEWKEHMEYGEPTGARYASGSVGPKGVGMFVYESGWANAWWEIVIVGVGSADVCTEGPTPQRAAANLRRHVRRLRDALGDRR